MLIFRNHLGFYLPTFLTVPKTKQKLNIFFTLNKHVLASLPLSYMAKIVGCGRKRRKPLRQKSRRSNTRVLCYILQQTLHDLGFLMLMREEWFQKPPAVCFLLWICHTRVWTSMLIILLALFYGKFNHSLVKSYRAIKTKTTHKF